MYHEHPLAAVQLPAWDSASQERGRQNAARLADLASQRPAQRAASLPRSTIGRVGICGAGIMGTGIAVANVKHGIPVRIYDAAATAVERAVTAVLAEIDLPQIAQSGPDAPLSTPAALLSGCRCLDDLASADLVIESVVENRELKQRILAQLAANLAPSAILATNTSTIRVSQLASSLPDPTRFCGLHFCNPVADRRLVEIVCGQHTSPATISAAVQYVVRIGKLPIVVQDSPGFLINRLLLPYLNEALEMVCQGAQLPHIDQAARLFGMANGPIELFDLIGIDTAMWAGRTLWEAFPERTALTPVLPALVKRGRLGQKTGRGFYRYATPESPAEIDDELSPILAPYLRRTQRFTTEEITLRLFLPILVEATRAIEDGVVGDLRDVDIGTLFGLAFPPERGGLLFWADSLGADTIVELLRQLEPLGKRMYPTQLLQTLAHSGARFYD